MESLRQSESIKTITVRHEQAGGFMAATYGRLTGLLSPILLFSGCCACVYMMIANIWSRLKAS